MRFNRLGNPVLGRGRRWLTDDRQIFQHGSDAAGWNLVDQHGGRIADGGAVFLEANAGRWADTGVIPGHVNRSNFGYDNPRGKVWDIGFDGTVLETPDHQAGTTVGVWSNPQSRVSGGGVADARAVAGGGFVAVFDGDRRIHSSAHGRDAAIPAGVKPFAAVLIGDLLLYHTHRWLILQEFGRPVGRVVAEAPTFSPDMVRIGNALRIGWCVSVGETPASFRTVDVPIDDLRFGDISSLRDAPPSPLPPTPPADSPREEPTPVSYERRSPDLTHLVRDAAQRFPAEWEAARKKPDGSRDDRFIRRCAWLLHQVDPRVGLNGKRGTDVISTDALGYLNPTGPGGVEVIDVITGDHRPAWHDVTIPVGDPEHPEGVLGKFIQPKNPAGSTQQPDPDEPDPDVRLREEIAEALKPILRRLETAEQANAQLRRDLDELKARVAADGPLLARAAVKSAHGTYLTAEEDGRVTHRENQPAAWQTFKIEKL